MSDREAYCWSVFDNWLETNSSFTRSRAALEKASLAPGKSAAVIYESVRKAWYQDCLRAKDNPAPGLGPNQFFGSTDGSFNVLSLQSGNTRSTEKTAEEKAAMRAEADVDEAKREAKEKLDAEQKLSGSIKAGDEESKKAAESAKESDVSVDPSEPASPVEAAAAASEAEDNHRKLLLQDAEKAKELLGKVQEESDSQTARIDAATAEIKEAQIAIKRAERANDADELSAARARVENLQAKLDEMQLEHASTLKLIDEMMDSATPEEPAPVVQTPEKAGIKWHVGPKAYSSDAPVQPPGVCMATSLAGGTAKALGLASGVFGVNGESMKRVDPVWRIVHLPVPDLCEGQDRPN